MLSFLKRDQMNECPFCHDKTPMATPINQADHEPPKPGDLSVCFTCGELAVFGENNLALRKPTEKERQDAMDNRELRQAVFSLQVQLAARKKR